jgi:hypothetical protein
MWVVVFCPVSRGYGQCTWAIFVICIEQIKKEKKREKEAFDGRPE